MLRRIALAMLGLAAGVMLQACAPDRPGAVPAAVDARYAAGEAAWRARRREDLLAPGGWTSLVGLHWIELEAHYIGSGPGSGIRLAVGPPRLALLRKASGRLWLTPEPGVALTVDGAEVTSRVALATDRDPSPSIVGFDEGRGTLSVIERGGRRALRVRHADAPTRTGFGRIDYWPADPSWRVDARWRPHAPGRTIEIANIVGTLEQTPNPGVVEFERDGRAFRLEALAGSDGGLFLVLADRTSGHASYGAGRYIDIPASDIRGARVVVDFNRAHNPPCAFTQFATCPLPPPENRLDLAITAGEKRYVAPRNAAPRTP